MDNEGTTDTPEFLGIPKESRTPLEKSFFVILPCPYEQSTTYGKGTRFGPQAIINASYQVELFDEEMWLETWKIFGVSTIKPFTHSDSPEIFMNELSNYARPFVKKGKFVLMLGGEHAITEGLLKPVAEKYKNLSVLQFDAHADMRKEYHGSKFNHACAAHRMMQYCKVVQVGIRSISEDEYKYCNTKKVRTFLRHANLNIDKLVKDVLNELTENVYITIDVDGLDPSIIPGTGTPVPGGLSWEESTRILREVIAKKKVVAADVTELAPISGTHVSEFATARLVYKIISYVTAKKLGKLK